MHDSSVYQSIMGGIQGLIGGFAMTWRHMFRRPITESYPEEKRKLPARTRATIILTRDPDGEERCVACYLCSGVCPVNCISMQSAERSDGRRHAAWFRINFSRCIFCGFCEEACPTLAIQLTPHFETCRKDILGLLFEKEDLLVNHGGKNTDYNFYHHSGVAVSGDKGTHLHESAPVDIRSLMP